MKQLRSVAGSKDLRTYQEETTTRSSKLDAIYVHTVSGRMWSDYEGVDSEYVRLLRFDCTVLHLGVRS